MKKGTVVCSKAGHDQEQFLLVWAVDGDDIYLVDGKSRPIERPKRKNRKHVCATKTVVSLPEPVSNRGVREALKSFQATCFGNGGNLLGER